MRIKAATVLLLLAPALASAQSPGTAVETALSVLVGGLGGCGPQRRVISRSVGFFPTVRFTQSTCVLEHGDSARATVGIDGDSVLYLFASRDAFNFLVARHPPSGLDSATALSYAYTVLELSGEVLDRTPVNTPTELPAAARASVRRGVRDFPYVETIFDGRGWDITIVTADKGESKAHALWRHNLMIGRDGTLLSLQSVILWRPPGTPMPQRRTGSASKRLRPNDR